MKITGASLCPRSRHHDERLYKRSLSRHVAAPFLYDPDRAVASAYGIKAAEGNPPVTQASHYGLVHLEKRSGFRVVPQSAQFENSVTAPSGPDIGPSLSVPVIRQSPEGQRVVDLLRWGLILHWSKDATIGAKLANARSESVSSKPSFRDAFKRRRCIVPASEFYEWQATPSGKQPYYIRLKSDEPMALAGLWESWPDTGAESRCALRSLCIRPGIGPPIPVASPIIETDRRCGKARIYAAASTAFRLFCLTTPLYSR